ncbi:MAG: peptidase U32 family protein [Nitrospirota bacterium]
MIELCSPAGSLLSLKAAIDNGADAVYIGLNNNTNLRNFPGLNITGKELEEGITYTHDRDKKVYLTINSYPQYRQLEECYRAIDTANISGVDALIVSDIAVLEYAQNRYSSLPIHLSVQTGLTNNHAIKFFRKHFNIKRVILPRVFNLEEISQLRNETDIELEIFAIGLLCINCEGKCFLSSFLTGESINTYGACSHPKFVNFISEEDGLRVTSNGITLNLYKEDERAAYPTPCKGRYFNQYTKKYDYVFQRPESLNIIDILPQIISIGINALKIEGRQRSHSYVAKTTRLLRDAIEQAYSKKRLDIKNNNGLLQELFEGLNNTSGCYLEK